MVQLVMDGAFVGIMSDAILQRRTKTADVVLCVFGLGLGAGLVYYGNTTDCVELVGSLRGITDDTIHTINGI